MIQIQINLKEDEVYFVDVPVELAKFRIAYYGFAGTWLEAVESGKLNNWKILLPSGRYEILGFTKDIVVGEIKWKENFMLKKI